MRPTLHAYQREAMGFLHGVPRGGLFLDMGLGKTAVSLSALTPEHLPALVIAPKRVAESVWPAETRKWRPDLRCVAVAGTPAQRRAAFESRAHIYALGRDNLGDLAVPGSRPLRVNDIADRFRTIIIDESSGFKDYTTNRWKIAKPLTFDKPFVWELTGTPTPNGLMDLWAPTYLVDRGARLGPNITTFRNRYFTPGRQLPTGVITEWLLKPGADERIHEKVEDLFLYMSSEGRIDLPPTTYNRVSVELPPRVRTAYKKMKRDLMVDLREVFGDDLSGIHSGVNPAVVTNRLCQIAAGCLYPDDTESGLPPTELHREKVNAVLEIVEGTGAPILAFYRFKWEKARLLEIPGAVSIEEPDSIDRWNAGKIRLLVAHPQSAGHGLNLQQGGYTIVWTSLPWSLEEWQQANKRLARQGQQHPVVIHYIVAEKTVDDVVWSALRDKDTMQDALLRHLESPL